MLSNPYMAAADSLTGHPYYYNALTQQSTYTRPKEEPSQPNPQAHMVYPPDGFGGLPPNSRFHGLGLQQPPYTDEPGSFGTTASQPARRGGFRGHGGRQGPQPKDRPKSKHAIPGCEPWLLVQTSLGRRFVYDPDKNESFWKFPPDVMKAVVEYDRLERERKVRGETSDSDGKAEEPTLGAEEQTSTILGPMPLDGRGQQNRLEGPVDESDEYEEVEITDEEDDDENAAKRQKTEDEAVAQPVEFNEDDIAYQLAAMGQDYGLDPGEYGDPEGEDLEEGAAGLPLSEEDASALFKDMLDDHHINPYKPWDKLIEDGRIVEDDRYTVLPNMKIRKEVWDEWSRNRIQKLKEQREKEEKKDPRIPYLAFLQDKATPKLYWPEFRRKYMKEPEMRNTKLPDKEREKLYRDYINRKTIFVR